jgi:hypothetical protein
MFNIFEIRVKGEVNHFELFFIKCGKFELGRREFFDDL